MSLKIPNGRADTYVNDGYEKCPINYVVGK